MKDMDVVCSFKYIIVQYPLYKETCYNPEVAKPKPVQIL